MTETCYFCRELVIGANQFLENELAVARWDGYPLSAGHAEIIPKRHVQYVEELSDEEFLAVMQLVRQAVSYIRQTDLRALYEQKIAEVHDDPLLEKYYRKVLTDYEGHERAMDAYNLGLNNGVEAGQTVPHVHLHVIPRWRDDVTNVAGGVRNVLPDFAKDDWDL